MLYSKIINFKDKETQKEKIDIDSRIYELIKLLAEKIIFWMKILIHYSGQLKYQTAHV